MLGVVSPIAFNATVFREPPYSTHLRECSTAACALVEVGFLRLHVDSISQSASFNKLTPKAFRVSILPAPLVDERVSHLMQESVFNSNPTLLLEQWKRDHDLFFTVVDATVGSHGPPAQAKLVLFDLTVKAIVIQTIKQNP